MGDKGEQEEESHQEWKLGWKLCQCKRVEQARSWSGVASLELEEPEGEGGGFVCGSEPGYHQGPLQEAGDFSELRPQHYENKMGEARRV